MHLGKSRGYPNTIVNSGDVIGQITSGADGTDLERQGGISAIVDGTPGCTMTCASFGIWHTLEER